MRLNNQTPFAAASYVVQDQRGADLLIIVVKATYDMRAAGGLSIAELQAEPVLGDQYYDSPEKSGVKYASDIAYGKAGSDIALIGHAHAPGGYATEAHVRLRVGNIQKNLIIFGDRFWKERFGVAGKTKPEPFDKIPLRYEMAFGGVDTSNKDPQKHEAELRNLVGTGFRAKKSKLPVDGMRLPNIEDPEDIIKSPYTRPKPAGLGFISPMWVPRLGYTGTYDQEWEKRRMPLPPRDFDTRFFNSAHPDLVYPGFLRGDEPVSAHGVSRHGIIHFSLPDVHPLCLIQGDRTVSQSLDMYLDALTLNTDDMKAFLLWRACLNMPERFEDIEEITCVRRQ